MFKIPYKILLAYHSPAGNTIRMWTYYQMLSHIIAIRKEIHILSLTFTVIQIRRALNVLFQRVNTRGSFLIYTSPSNGIKMELNSVFTTVTSWLPGLLTNYRQVILSIRRNKHYNEILTFYLKRPQMYAIETVNILARPLGHKLRKKPQRRVPSLPSISLSLSDNTVWLNETVSLGIPSIQICDTQTKIQKLSYPIIANQKSVTFNYLIASLFAETCNYSLLFEHLYFLSIFKYINVRRKIKKKMKKKKIFVNELLLKRNSPDFLGVKKDYHTLKKSYNMWYTWNKYKRKVKKKKKKMIFKIQNQGKKILQKNHTKFFIFNTKRFRYQLMDNNYKYKSHLIEYENNNYTFLVKIKKILANIFKLFYKRLTTFEMLEKRLRKKRMKRKRKKKLRKIFIKLNSVRFKLYKYRRYLKIFYVRIFGLSSVLTFRYKQKKRFLNTIRIKQIHIPNKLLCGMIYSPQIVDGLKNLIRKNKRKMSRKKKYDYFLKRYKNIKWRKGLKIEKKKFRLKEKLKIIKERKFKKEITNINEKIKTKASKNLETKTSKKTTSNTHKTNIIKATIPEILTTKTNLLNTRAKIKKSYKQIKRLKYFYNI